MAMATPLQTCFTKLKQVNLGHGIAIDGPSAEIRTPGEGGIRKTSVLTESVANWLHETTHIGGLRIKSSTDRRAIASIKEN